MKFQDSSFNGLKVTVGTKSVTHARTHPRTHPRTHARSKSNMPHQLFQSWGHNHTCDTFLNPNREIWNFWSGNLCLVSGGFHDANFGPFLPKLKSRNLVTFLEICYRASQCQHMPTEVRICVRLQFKKPPLILL